MDEKYIAPNAHNILVVTLMAIAGIVLFKTAAMKWIPDKGSWASGLRNIILSA